MTGNTTRAGISRREALGLALAGGAGAAALAVAPGTARAARVATSARIVVVGGGAAGISIAKRLSDKLDGADITILEKRLKHHYQPGYTLVATGFWKADDVIVENADYMPDGVRWVRAHAAAIDPDAQAVETDDGQRLDYDYLVVAPGLHLDYARIEGFSLDLIGKNGVGSVYAGNQYAARTWEAISRFVEEGGVGLYTSPQTAIKCAGAPIKVMFMSEQHMLRADTRSKADIRFMTAGSKLFSAPVYNARIGDFFAEKGIPPHYGNTLIGLDAGAKRARFLTDGGVEDIDYDFIHVVPPMRAPDCVKDSPLAWRDGKFAAGGWLEVDPVTLRHRRYPNVFGAGDVVGTPFGKTAATVKNHAPVVAGNLVDVIAGRDPSWSFDGYTSCPLLTRIGYALLVEFDYSGEPSPTIPLDPTVERPLWWNAKLELLKPIYLQMLRGNTDFLA